LIIFLRLSFIVTGALTGFLITSSFSQSGIKGIIYGIIGSLIITVFDFLSNKLSIKELVIIFTGLVAGLMTASLVSYGISNTSVMNDPKYSFIQIIIYSAFIYLGISILYNKRNEIYWLNRLTEKPSDKVLFNPKILDTSSIIDGRIAEIIELGFLDGDIFIPKFVLNELQMIADSSDVLKRHRGRRGLDIVCKMQKASLNVKIYEEDSPGNNVDSKLVSLAKKLKGKIVTNDFNLNKVASAEQVLSLNLNDLSNAVKPIVMSGETMKVKIIKEGKEQAQGISYLDDGTMIVIDGAKNYVNQSIEIVITSVIQTSAGRMIFAKKKEL
jgi:uncharacterized protein YacL